MERAYYCRAQSENTGEKIINKDIIKKKLYSRSEYANAMSEDSFSKWLHHTVTSTAVWSFSDRILRYFRKFRLIRLVFTAISYIFTFLGTGVAFIAFSAILLFVLPILALFGIAIVFASVLERKKICAEMEQILENKSVIVFFSERDNENLSCAFQKKMILEHASENGCVSILVSPYFISPKGLFKKSFYISVREEGDRIFTVRKYVFFALKNKILKSKCASTVFFY